MTPEEIEKRLEALAVALETAVRYHEAWHAVSNWNTQSGYEPLVTRILAKAAEAWLNERGMQVPPYA